MQNRTQKIHIPVTLALCNFLDDSETLRSLGLEYGFGGIDWSFDLSSLPQTPADENLWIESIKELSPFEIRYHCPFPQVDIGHENPSEQKRAAEIFSHIIQLISKAGGKYLTIHVGLGRDTTRNLSWERTLTSLKELVRLAQTHHVHLCLENLAWGWTAKPNLFEKLIRLSGAGITFDIGHARACEAVRTQHYAYEDFVAPHMDRVFNAHVYHDEVDGVGHVPPEVILDIEDRLDILMQTACRWWTLEIREPEGLKQTRKIIDQYFENRQV
jgi:sugar phosphate isomerase/epimerase